MNSLNNLTVQAVRIRGQLQAPDRDVSTTPDGWVSVKLHGQEVLRLNGSNTVINGQAPTTRKTTRLLNAILTGVGHDQTVLSKEGHWYVRNADGVKNDYTGVLYWLPAATKN